MAFETGQANPGDRLKHGRPSSSRSYLLFLLAGLVLGGAGERYLVIELALAIAAAILVVGWSRRGDLCTGPGMRRLFGLGAVWTGLALAFMVPVPPFAWHAVTQRSAAAPVLAALSLNESWRGMGLDPDRAMLFLLSLPLPIAGFWLTYSSTRKQVSRAVQVLLAFAAVSALLACVQLASGGLATLYVFSTAHQGSGSGLFVNRNHLALLLLVTIPFLTTSEALPTRLFGASNAKAWRVGLLTLLALGVLATVSRTAFALLLPIGAMAGWKMWGAKPSRLSLAGILVFLVVSGGLASQMPVFRTLAERYGSLSGDFRYEYWGNTVFLLERQFPFGTGPGSFARLYATIEPLTQVRPQFVGHAHNDWLETSLELGLPGVACLVALIWLLAILVRRAWKKASHADRPMVTATVTGLILIGIFSLVDFPLRMPAIALTGSLLLGILARHADGDDLRAILPLQGFRLAAVIAIGLGVGLTLACAVVSRQLVRGGLPQAASAIAPWSGAALSARAQMHAEAGSWSLASRDARVSLARQPLDPRALRVLAQAFQVDGKLQESSTFLSLAASMGWRDLSTQLWVAQAAQDSGQIEAAVERYDALLRQGVQDEDIYRNLTTAVGEQGGLAAIANRLEERPGWAQGFFNVLGMAPPPTPMTLRLLAELRKRSVPVTLQGTALLRWTLWDRRQFSDVTTVWRASGGAALLGDGNFTDLDGELPVSAAPYSWYAPRLPGVSVVAVTDGMAQSSHVLQVTSEGHAVGAVLAQSVVLASGHYTVALRTSGETTLPLRLSVTCFDARLDRWNETGFVLATRPPGAGFSGVLADFVVDDGCPALALNVGIDKATGREGRVTIEQAEIRKVAIDMAGEGRALDLP